MSACQQNAQTASSATKIGVVARAEGAPAAASAPAIEALAREAGPAADVQFLQTHDRDDDVGRLQLLGVQNYTTIVGVGSELAPAVQRVAQALPKLQFVLIDGFADGPNIDSVAIADTQPAYLAGVLAGLSAANHHVVAVVSLGPARSAGFTSAFRAGVREADPSIVPVVINAGPARPGDPLAAAVRAGAGSLTIAGALPVTAASIAAVAARVPVIAYGFDAPAAIATAPDALVLAVKMSIEQAQAQKIPSGPHVVGPSDGLRLTANAAAFGRLPAEARARYTRLADAVESGAKPLPAAAGAHNNL